MNVAVLNRPNLELRSVIQPPTLGRDPDEPRFPRREYRSCTGSAIPATHLNPE